MPEIAATTAIEQLLATQMKMVGRHMAFSERNKALLDRNKGLT
jgi:hypothetical protein